jgi:hypothetical protein
MREQDCQAFSWPFQPDRVGSQRVTCCQARFQLPPPNRAGYFHSTRLSKGTPLGSLNDYRFPMSRGLKTTPYRNASRRCMESYS